MSDEVLVLDDESRQKCEDFFKLCFREISKQLRETLNKDLVIEFPSVHLTDKKKYFKRRDKLLAAIRILAGDEYDGEMTLVMDIADILVISGLMMKYPEKAIETKRDTLQTKFRYQNNDVQAFPKIVDLLFNALQKIIGVEADRNITLTKIAVELIQDVNNSDLISQIPNDDYLELNAKIRLLDFEKGNIALIIQQKLAVELLSKHVKVKGLQVSEELADDEIEDEKFIRAVLKKMEADSIVTNIDMFTNDLVLSKRVKFYGILRSLVTMLAKKK